MDTASASHATIGAQLRKGLIYVSEQELDDLQRRAELLAHEVFTTPEWTGPQPLIIVDSRVPARNRARAITRPGREVIRIHPEVFADPPDVIRGTFAHEAAHVLQGRPSGWAAPLIGTAVLWAAAIACCVRGAEQPHTSTTSASFGAAIIAALLALRMAVIPSRRYELRADALSAQLVGGAVVERTLRHLNTQTPALNRLAATLGLDTHPSPRQRIRRLRAALARPPV